MLSVGFFGLVIFVGYLVGRWCHYWLNPRVGNPAWAPHHWIYGLLGIALGWYIGGMVGMISICFSLGFFISDGLDLLHGEVIGPDDLSKPLRFWGFD